ncbi:winged helix-turn-helix transcriptional regulator [Streptomyces sp. Tu 2975]|uniref:MarR family winged helix-turn-helix transcriptional regulator n=1 Tax=Streptomyces sp. Tu 2975 TaxID=2676871 RepID=UPI001357C4D3|nr:MarR family winged helix-turn-helix transcriptional regulator [Streptomyces sp. Tu 2975]QIP87850.1 winged helix-turn-helix transcriptional regulator [Streptomyces sp. Tu 2975]
MSTNETDPPVRWLATDEERVWRAYLRMVTAVQARTAQDLAAHGLSDPDYEVLSTLSERTDGTSTLREQAAKMGWSRSRLSRHATRMEARGLIRRAPDPADGRGCFLVLTETGWDTLREAAPTHVASVRRHFVDRLDPGELAALGRIAEKIADGR